MPDGSTNEVRLQRCPPMWTLLAISLPYGVLSGAVSGSLLAYLLRSEGVAVSRIANEVAVLILPATLFFLWSPLTDFWMRRRTWLVVSSGVAAVGVIAAFRLPSFASPVAEALLFFSTCVVLMGGAASGGIMAELVPDALKARAASMHQAGNMGGGALGAGGLLALSSHMSRPALGWVAAALIFLPSLAALRIQEAELVPVAGEGLGRRLRQIGREFQTSFLCWAAVPSLLLLMSPLGAGGAIGLLSGIARDYGVSGNQVAWLNGLAGGLLTAAGALLIALVPGRIDIRLTYALMGLANALAIGVLCVGPMRPMTYLVGSVFYQLTVGACWAVFTALVLQVVGGAGKSGCARFAIAMSLGNLPVAYMAAVDGLGAKWWGTRGLPGIDMAVSGLFAVGVLGWLFATKAARIVEAAGEQESQAAI